MKKYFPLLLSKAGELNALKNLSDKVKDNISPILNVLQNSEEKIINFCSENWTFPNNQILFDFTHCDSITNYSIFGLIDPLLLVDVNVIPVVSSYSSPKIINEICSLLTSNKVKKLAIRLIFENGDLNKIQNIIDEFIIKTNLSTKSILLLLDFGIVSLGTYPIYANFAKNKIQNLLNSTEYHEIIISSGSFPKNLTPFVSQDAPHLLKRYEWLLWNEITSNLGLNISLKYSDYGTKHPIFEESNFLGTCSIKYSTENYFIIYRGEKSSNHKDGNGQYINYANLLIKSNNYPGSGFSWGDYRINEIASQISNTKKKKPGNSTSWVEISQNHHITLIEGLL
ncbi:beta family protein [Sphingobacterium cellulitidis]|uniref:beta family protein n=1 Tax=Sphingobacterium cellulitidis TaxID=1768011 RepID=UPI000B93C441|nr:hypothetical protein CHT99_15655 [Sphingobacterium cellulitidis]